MKAKLIQVTLDCRIEDILHLGFNKMTFGIYLLQTIQ